MCAESSSLCFSWASPVNALAIVDVFTGASLLPFLACDAKQRRTSWWWRHVPFTPLCIMSSSSLQSKVGSNLNIVSFTIKNEIEFAYFKCKLFDLSKNCWCCLVAQSFQFYGVILFPDTTIRANTFFFSLHLKFFRFFQCKFVFVNFSIFNFTYLFLSICNEFRIFIFSAFNFEVKNEYCYPSAQLNSGNTTANSFFLNPASNELRANKFF